MDSKPLYLWSAYPDDLSTESVAEMSLAMLSNDERVHWRSLHFDRDRREYLATHALVRTALSHYYPLAPEAWRFRLNSYGKPFIDPDCGLRFNLSNSLNLVVCLIGVGTEVGIDLEPYTRAKDILDLAETVFSPIELTQLQVLRGDMIFDRALSLWTLKEAFIKATGIGLSLPLKMVSFLFDGANQIQMVLDPCLCTEPDRHWRFCLLDYVGHRIALMADQTSISEVQLWDLQPSLAPPKRLTDIDATWFPVSYRDESHA